MKQRVTYLLPAGTGLQPSDIQIQAKSIDFLKAHQAAEEWRITLGLQELPDELRSILEQCHELHLRWASPEPRQLFSPLHARVPPGLHAFFTPLKSDEEVPLCPLLQSFVKSEDAKCVSVRESFARISVLSERFAQASTFQWHTFSPLDTRRLANTILGNVCGPETSDETWKQVCDSLVQDLDRASHVDIDFDAISHALTLIAYWDVGDGALGRDGLRSPSRQYRKAGTADRLEIGVLQDEPSKELEQLTLGGYLTVVEEDDRPSPTYFSFPSRHHPLPAGSTTNFTTNFQHPTGLHPKLQIQLSQKQLRPPQPSCRLHTYLTLPSALFIDRYQLSDRLFLDSQNLVALHSLAGARDLEAPDWVTTQWGSTSLLQLAVPNTATSAKSRDQDWTVTIPLHLRYLDRARKPTDGRGESTLQVPWPVVFWACEADEGLKMSNNPFDRVNLGYDGLFGPKTMFYHVPPSMGSGSGIMVEEIKVPILNADNAGVVQTGTLIAVAVGFAWVCWRLVAASVQLSGGKEGKEQ